jgi:hypothetical protein
MLSTQFICPLLIGSRDNLALLGINFACSHLYDEDKDIKCMFETLIRSRLTQIAIIPTPEVRLGGPIVLVRETVSLFLSITKA